MIGSRHRVRIVKNKVSPPFRVAEFDVMHDGISKEGGLIDVGLELNILTKSGAFLKYGTQMLGQGREAAKIFLKANLKKSKKPDLVETVTQLLHFCAEAINKQPTPKVVALVGPCKRV